MAKSFSEEFLDNLPEWDSHYSKVAADPRKGREVLLWIARGLRDGDDVPKDLRLWLGEKLERMVLEKLTVLQAMNPTGDAERKLPHGWNQGWDSLGEERHALKPGRKRRLYTRAFLEGVAWEDAPIPDKDAKDKRTYLEHARDRPRTELAGAVDRAAIACDVKTRTTIRRYVRPLHPWCETKGLDAIAKKHGVSRGEALVGLIRGTRKHVQFLRSLDAIFEPFLERELDLFGPKITIVTEREKTKK